MSRLQKYLLNEKYFGRVDKKYGEGSFEVFVNPSTKELKEVDNGDGVRFTADSKSKRVYVWDADKAIHNSVWDEESSISKGRDFNSASCDEVLHGTCELKGGKFHMDYSDEMEYQESRKDFDVESLLKTFNWVNKYIKIDGYLNSIRSNYE